MSHFKEVCPYGYVHSQCRCPDPNKTVRAIDCPNPQRHSTLPPSYATGGVVESHVPTPPEDPNRYPLSTTNFWCPKCSKKALQHDDWTFFRCLYCGAISQLFEVKL